MCYRQTIKPHLMRQPHSPGQGNEWVAILYVAYREGGQKKHCLISIAYCRSHHLPYSPFTFLEAQEQQHQLVPMVLNLLASSIQVLYFFPLVHLGLHCWLHKQLGSQCNPNQESIHTYLLLCDAYLYLKTKEFSWKFLKWLETLYHFIIKIMTFIPGYSLDNFTMRFSFPESHNRLLLWIK